MILIDNNVLSTFAKVGRLALLFQVTAIKDRQEILCD